MAGLPTNNDSRLQQWHQLFIHKEHARSHSAQQHWEQALQLGIPTPRHEDWKYTPLDGVLSQQFERPVNASLAGNQLEQLALPVEAIRLVFVDGRFNAALSDPLTEGISISEQGNAEPLPAPIQKEFFLHLTESLAEEITLIRVACDSHLSQPLYLLHLSSHNSQDKLNTVSYRHHLHLENGAQATVIEHYCSLHGGSHFTTARCSASVADNAQLTNYKLAFEHADSVHFAHNDFVIGRDSRVTTHSFLLGAGLCRHQTSVQLNGEGSELSLNSLMLPVGNEICDSRSYLEHNLGHCQSRQLHKTIVRDQGRAVFNGMIKVAKYALKTDGQMTNNNLLLGERAEVYTKPQLEIYADDVKCSHGATTGRIDDEQLFYLRSRGIAAADAQQMIVHAFAAELTEAIEDEALKTAVMQRIALRFPGSQA
ncbi:MAG: FeS cluster assembly protein SufD [Candidatus Erwinia impunctatus]|nr:FeS cluster assembly protein SufD [Culicoides impunctatus]